MTEYLVTYKSKSAGTARMVVHAASIEEALESAKAYLGSDSVVTKVEVQL